MIQVFARSPGFKPTARLVGEYVEAFMVEVVGKPPEHASKLADGWDHFRLEFPRALKQAIGFHAVDQAVDIAQVTRETYRELEHWWQVRHPNYSPQAALLFGLEHAWAVQNAPPAPFEEIDDFEVVSQSNEENHNAIFEGSRRERKGRWEDLGIRPNAFTGDISAELKK